MANFFTLVFLISFLMAMKSCSGYKHQVVAFPEEKRQAWVDSCMRSVEMSCYYADCAITPIEVMQEKICRVPDDL